VKLTRELVQTARCPACDAAAGEPCTGRRGVRRASHSARCLIVRTWELQHELEQRNDRERARV
jgi:hypothetical protein